MAREPIGLESLTLAYDTADAGFNLVWKELHINWTVAQRLRVVLNGLGRSLPPDAFDRLVEDTGHMEVEIPPDPIAGIGEALAELPGTDLLRDPQHDGRVLAAIGSRRRAHTNEGELRGGNRGRAVVRDSQSTARDRRLHHLLNPVFHDGGAATLDQAKLLRIDIDADDLMPVPSQARHRNGTHVT